MARDKRDSAGENTATRPLTFERAFERELEVIAGKRRRRSDNANHPYDHVKAADEVRSNLFGLAFSGGGIRSATFNLGILQALSELHLLRRVDILSTVSGGGYIGAWLSSLIRREEDTPSEDPPGAGETTAIDRVERRLHCGPRANPASAAHCSPGESEDPAIAHLRQYSNYLTPKLGALTMDTWTAVAVYLRNVLLNLLIIVPAIAAVFLVPFVLGAFAEALWGEPPRQAVSLVVTGLLFALGLVAAGTTGRNLASIGVVDRRPGDRGVKPPDTLAALQAKLILPIVGMAVLFSLLVGPASPQTLESIPGIILPGFLARLAGGSPYAEWAMIGSVVFLAQWAVAWAAASLAMRSGNRDLSVAYSGTGWAWLTLTGAVSGAVGGVTLYTAFTLTGAQAHVLLGLAWGVPCFLLAVLAAFAIHKGFAGRLFVDMQREWLSRLAAWVLILLLIWVGVFGIMLYSPPLFDLLQSGAVKSALTSGWLATVLGGVLANRSTSPGIFSRLLVAVAPHVFIVGLLMAVATGVYHLLGVGAGWIDGAAFTGISPGSHALLTENYLGNLELVIGHPLSLAVTLAVLAGFTLLFSWRVGVNDFSMHNFYGNRLIRAYLGATVPPEVRARRRQPFTGFNQGDDLRLHGFYQNPLKRVADGARFEDFPGPLHIVNTAVNLVSGTSLAWQERKAASFTLTPEHCGYEFADDEAGGGARSGGYRCSDEFSSDTRALTLGNAITTSGAAASPNMGFRSSPALTFLMTVFNVRLGRWVGNPAQQGWKQARPRFPLMLLVHELLGQTNTARKYVYLSDGGHFENLGIYELVRRRCRYIIACDAGADPDLAFDDLGNAIRKCRADFGVDIDINVERIRRSAETGNSEWHCAVGKIRYPAADRGSRTGILLYIKSSLVGDEPADVLNYHAQNPQFPHETTADQFFGESQFESYRMLGRHIGLKALRTAHDQCGGQDHAGINLSQLFSLLSYHWSSSGRVDPQRLVVHTAKLDEIFERLRTTDELHFLNPQLYPEWRSVTQRLPDEAQGPGATPVLAARGGPENAEESLPALSPLQLPSSERGFTAGFYFCNSLIQLMENVYLDLDLENHWQHADNRGWMNLFRHWSWTGMFKVTYAICASTYGTRFQLFCKHRLGLGLGTVELGYNDLGEADLERLRETRQAVPLDAFGSLNFLEQAQIEAYLRQLPDDDASRFAVYELNLHVGLDSINSVASLASFCFGYALVEWPQSDAAGSAKIHLFRVQDHLRQMGLGRQALLGLLHECRSPRGDGKVRGPFDREQRALMAELRTANPGLFGDFSKLNLERFREIFSECEQQLPPRTPGERGAPPMGPLRI